LEDERESRDEKTAGRLQRRGERQRAALRAAYPVVTDEFWQTPLVVGAPQWAAPEPARDAVAQRELVLVQQTEQTTWERLGRLVLRPARQLEQA